MGLMAVSALSSIGQRYNKAQTPNGFFKAYLKPQKLLLKIKYFSNCLSVHQGMIPGLSESPFIILHTV